MGNEIFIQAFEDATLPFENWTHEAHLRMAWNYITEYGKEKAMPFIRYVKYLYTLWNAICFTYWLNLDIAR